MTSKVLDWKIQPDLTHVKTIQYDAVLQLRSLQWGDRAVIFLAVLDCLIQNHS